LLVVNRHKNRTEQSKCRKFRIDMRRKTADRDTIGNDFDQRLAYLSLESKI
jgi:hypothetical protein